MKLPVDCIYCRNDLRAIIQNKYIWCNKKQFNVRLNGEYCKNCSEFIEKLR